MSRPRGAEVEQSTVRPNDVTSALAFLVLTVGMSNSQTVSIAELELE